MAETLRLEGTESSDVILPGKRTTTTASFALERSTGGRMRLETTVANAKSLIIADGENVWTYLSATQTYMMLRQSNVPENDEFGRLKFARDPADFSGATIDREESLTFGGQQVPCYVVRAVYSSMPGSSARDARRTVWIAKSDDRILRDIWEYTGNATGAKVNIATDYSRTDWGMALADGRFVFTPPEGSRLVTADPATGIVMRSATPPAGTAPSNEIEIRMPTPTVGPKLSGRALLLHEVQPEYSAEARVAGLQGTVSLYVEVKGDGHPGTVQVMQGLGLGLEEKAVEAVKQWEFKPNPMAGNGLQCIIDVDVQFRLDKPAPWNVVSEGLWTVLPSEPHMPAVVKPVPKRYLAPNALACQSDGEAMVRFSIGKDGRPQGVRAAGGQGPASDASVKAVQGWQFEPATKDGELVESIGAVEFECRPDGMVLRSEQTPLLVYRVGGGVSAPVLIAKFEPEYSEEARRSKVQGTVKLYVQISPAGRATNMQVVQALGMGLDEKAMESVKLWQFAPGRKAGQPVTVEATIDVNFRLL